MTVRSILTCDGCGRTQTLDGVKGEEVSSWGVLVLGASKRDVCPVCVAGLGHGPTADLTSQTMRFDALTR